MVDGNTSSSGVGGNVYVNLPNSRDASTASYHTRPPPYGPGQQSFLLSGRSSQQQQHQQQPASQGSVYSRSDGSVQSSVIGGNGKLQSEESSLKTLKQQPYHVSNGVTSLATQRKLSNGYGSAAATNGYETPVSPGLSHNHRNVHPHRFQSDHHHHQQQQDYPTIDQSFHDDRLLKRDDSSVRIASAQPPPPSSQQAQEAKTPSCDSGLPNEETEFGSDGADSARPLLNHQQQQQRATPVTQQQQHAISPVASM